MTAKNLRYSQERLRSGKNMSLDDGEYELICTYTFVTVTNVRLQLQNITCLYTQLRKSNLPVYQTRR